MSQRLLITVKIPPRSARRNDNMNLCELCHSEQSEKSWPMTKHLLIATLIRA